MVYARTGPHFAKNYAEGGVVYTYCDDEAAKIWLLAVVFRQQLWKGATLGTGLAPDIVRTAKAFAWVLTYLLEEDVRHSPRCSNFYKFRMCH